MVTGIRFVQFQVHDLERSTRFYRDGLGLRVEVVAPSEGRRTACVEAGEFELVLIEDAAAGGPVGIGVQLYLNTHEVEHYCAALQSRGIETTPLAEEPWGARVTRVQDPDGYTLCFVQSRHQMMHDEP
jgi:catechol 2,3-dioxygenase-like lactoylglutathione lyase family enzyme